MSRIIFAALFAAMLTACGDSSPGPLAGTWQAGGIMPMRIAFRPGETEAMGIIEKVGYKTEGTSVLVTYKDGFMKGSSVRFQFVDASTVRGLDMTFRKVGN